MDKQKSSNFVTISSEKYLISMIYLSHDLISAVYVMFLWIFRISHFIWQTLAKIDGNGNWYDSHAVQSVVKKEKARERISYSVCI